MSNNILVDAVQSIPQDEAIYCDRRDFLKAISLALTGVVTYTLEVGCCSQRILYTVDLVAHLFQAIR